MSMGPSKTLVNDLDLSELDLAYALTTHKMEGSQAKIVICPILNPGYLGDFMNNHMLYTAISRAQKLCVLLGDVEGPYSTIEKMRRITVLDKRLSLFDKY